VADTDMGAMDDCFRSPCSQSTHPHLRFRPHTHDARCCITYLTRASAKSREISATRIVSSVRSVRMRTALRPGRRFHRVSTSEPTWKAVKGLPYPTTARAVSEAHDQSQQPSLRPLSESHRRSARPHLQLLLSPLTSPTTRGRGGVTVTSPHRHTPPVRRRPRSFYSQRPQQSSAPSSGNRKS
jgi:hypothetical protein